MKIISYKIIKHINDKINPRTLENPFFNNGFIGRKDIKVERRAMNSKVTVDESSFHCIIYQDCEGMNYSFPGAGSPLWL